MTVTKCDRCHKEFKPKQWGRVALPTGKDQNLSWHDFCPACVKSVVKSIDKWKKTIK